MSDQDNSAQVPAVPPQEETEKMIFDLFKVWLANRAQEQGKPVPPGAVIAADIDDEDLVAVYSMELWTKKGCEGRVSGSVVLPQILSQSMLQEAFRNFTNTLYAAFTRPTENKFIKLVNSRANEVDDAGEPMTLAVLPPPPRHV